jgi:hypothetical protein
MHLLLFAFCPAAGNSPRVAFPVSISPFGFNPVSSHLFGPIESLIRRIHYLVRCGIKGAFAGYPDAHGYRKLFPSPGGAGISGWLVGRSIFAPDGKRGRFYGAAKFLQKRNHPLYCMPGHDERELLPSISENLAEGYPFEARRDEPQDLVAYLMSIPIVEILEVIDIHHGDGIVPP